MNQWLRIDFDPDDSLSPESEPAGWDPTPPGELLAWVHTLLGQLESNDAASPAHHEACVAARQALAQIDLAGLPTRFGYGEWDTTTFEEALAEYDEEERWRA